MTDATERSWNEALEETQIWVHENTPWELRIESAIFNACEVTIVAALEPQKKVGQTLWPGGPHRAQVLFCNGPVSAGGGARLEATYRGLNQPVYVVAFGPPAVTSKALKQCPDLAAHIADLFPVHVFVLSFPPKPETLPDGVVQLLTPLAEAHPPAKRHSRLEDLPAEVLQRHLERLQAPPTQEERMRDQTLADRPPF